jgi:D-alanyl-D-alanine carboxypeptidase (penicillin-binding protein 5/6)
MIFDPVYLIFKLKRLIKARYEVARYRGEITRANVLRVGASAGFIFLSLSFGAVGLSPAGGEGRVSLALPPHLIAGAALPPKITAESAYVIDPASGFVLYDKNSARELPPASATKIVTALVAVSRYGLEDVVRVPSDCTFREGESLMGLFPNEQITVGNLLRGMLIVSGSDAACALASHFSAGESGFVEEMNVAVGSLGIERTHFVNPTGMDAESHYATAQELTLLASKVRDDPFLLEAVGTTEANVASADGRRWHKLETTNELLGVVPGFLGIKTGYTPKAKEVFVFYFKQGQVELLGAVMGSDDRFGDARALASWILGSFIFP